MGFYVLLTFQLVFHQCPHSLISQNTFQEVLFLYKQKCAEFEQFCKFTMHTFRVQRNLPVNKSLKPMFPNLNVFLFISSFGLTSMNIPWKQFENPFAHRRKARAYNLVLTISHHMTPLHPSSTYFLKQILGFRQAGILIVSHACQLYLQAQSLFSPLT